MVSISIMAHESRREFIPYIHEKLGYECPVAWDRYQDRRETGRRAWQLHDPEASHHLVLQDDVLLPRDLPQTLEQLVKIIPDQPISLFANDKKPWDKFIDKCRRRSFEVRWLVMPRLNWGPAILLPVKHIAPMLDWMARHVFLPNYDMAIAYYYLAARGLPVWYTMPSLVDHRTDGESLVWTLQSQKGRQARYFLGEGVSGAVLNWQGEVVCELTPMSKYLRYLMVVNESWRLRRDGNQVIQLKQSQP
jgi:hypothetical protein